MLEIYQKVKQGCTIRVLAMNNCLGHGEFFPMLDIDGVDYNILKWDILKATERFGSALIFTTGKGTHLYFPHTRFGSVIAVSRELDKYFDKHTEKEYHEVAQHRGYHSLRVSRYQDNAIRFNRKMVAASGENPDGKRLEEFILHLINQYGRVQI